MVGIGQTGSGKTLAFILPALAHIMKERAAQRAAASEAEDATAGGRRNRRDYQGPKVLVLAPTRELAKQIEEVAAMYRRACNIKTVCCIGGENRLSFHWSSIFLIVY
jgi:superfamily II DNA/RNA helicase